MTNQNDLYEAVGRILKEVKVDLQGQIENAVGEQKTGLQVTTLRLNGILELVSELNRTLAVIETTAKSHNADLRVLVDARVEAVNDVISEKTRLLADEIAGGESKLIDHLGMLDTLYQGIEDTVKQINTLSETLSSQELGSRSRDKDLADTVQDRFIVIEENLQSLASLEELQALNEARLDADTSLIKRLDEIELTTLGYAEDIGGRLDDHGRALNYRSEEIKRIENRLDDDTFERRTKSDISDLNDSLLDQARTTNNVEIRIDNHESSVNEQLTSQEKLFDNRLKVIKEELADGRKELLEDIGSDLSVLLEERTKASDIQLFEQTTDFIHEMSDKLKGERGESGTLKRVQKWVEEYSFRELDVVKHRGGLWQALRQTDKEPSSEADDWILIANGLFDIDVNLEADISKWILSVETADGVNHQYAVNLPLPVDRGTWNAKTQYNFYDAVIKDGHSWRAEVQNPRGKPGESEDWALWAMRGARGQRGYKGEKGDVGPEPSTVTIVKALDDYDTQIADKSGGTPIRCWRNKWKYQNIYSRGDMVEFGGDLWLCIQRNEGGDPPDKVGSFGWTLMS